MSKLEIVKFLINEIEAEQKLFAEYNKVVSAARSDGDYWQYMSRNWGSKREPKKSRIKNNCLKVRQLLLEIGKEGIK